MTNARMIVKYVVRTATAGIAADTIQKTLIHLAPKTEQLKVAEITGNVGGMIVAAKMMPYTDVIVDHYFDKFEARKKTT